ncbi:MAG TPA: acyl carrier protein [Pseudonocardiaceae bacterium]|jgi:acyl carrier protein|nr:acyl carrier protein [Pseudonocardiaceae bacterium]
MDVTSISVALELIANKAQLLPEEIDLDGTLEDAGLDSLHLMEMAMAVQREYGTEVPEGDLRLDQTVTEAIAYLDLKMR